MYKISVIIPVYNAENFLKRCINSVLDQSYQNLEIIIVNDGSTDSSLNILKEFSKKDNRIVLLNQDNKGVSSARNRGLKLATGDYITFLDSDDYIEINMYDEMMRYGKEYNADIVECSVVRVNERGDNLRNFNLNFQLIASKKLCIESYIKNINTTAFNWNKIYRKSVVEDVFFPNLKYSEDYYFNVLTHSNCDMKVTIPNAYNYYVEHSNSVTQADFSPEKLDILKSADLVIDFLKENHQELVIYAILYKLNNIRLLYFQIKQEKNSFYKNYSDYLISSYNNIYDKNKETIKSNELSTKLKSMLWLFRRKPILSNQITKYSRYVRKTIKIKRNKK